MSDRDYVVQGLIHELAVEFRKLLEKQQKALVANDENNSRTSVTLTVEKQPEKSDPSQVTYSSSFRA